MDHKIEKYLAVVEYGSFTEAAENLRISQPSLSVAIKGLERELDVQLIIRGGNFFQVTEEGWLVYEYASQARLQLENLKSVLASEKASQRLLKVGMIDSVASGLFKSKEFDISRNLTVRIDNSSRLLKALRLDQLDIAIITKPFDALDDEYEMVAECSEKFELVCAPDRAKEVRAELINKHTLSNFSTYDQQSTTFRWINKHLVAKGVELRPSFYSTSPDLMLQTVLKGRGSALLPRGIVQDKLKAKKLTRVARMGFERPIAVVTLKGKYLSKEMNEMIILLEDEFSKKPKGKRGGHYA